MSKLHLILAATAFCALTHSAWGQVELQTETSEPPVLNLRATSEAVQTARQFTGDLRDIAKTANVQREIPERHRRYQKQMFNWATPGNWTVPEGPVTRAPAPAPIMNFIGLDRTGFGSGSPPDTVGDVGPTYYIQSVNSSIGIYRKSDGVRVVGLTLDNFMSQGAFGNLCDTDNFGDPVVLYDTFEDRWIITDFAFQLDASNNVLPPGMLQCFAISRTGDPVGGGWNFYSFNTTGGLGDYGKFAIWPDGLYMTFNMFDYAATGGYQNARVYAFDKMKMYAGDPNPGLIRVDLPANEFTVLPSHARLQTGTPPAGAPNYYVSNASFFDSMQVYKFSVNWNNVSLSSFTGPSNTSIPTYAEPPATVPVSGGNNNDTLGSRLMMQNQYVNLGGVESLWNSFTVQGSNSTRAAVRWVQLNITGGNLAAAAVQSATHSPDSTNRYIPSIGVDRAGNMALGYSTSSSSERAAIRYAGRFAGDVVNTLPQTEQTLVLSTGSQTNAGGTLERWGDYAAMSLDPDDGCTFWFTSEYFIANGTNWQTRIGSFRYPSANCTSAVAGSLSGTVTAQTGGAPIAGAVVRLGARSTVTNAAGFYSFPGLASGTYPQLAASAASFVDSTVSNLQINSGASAVQNFALANAATGLQCLTDTTQANFGTGTGTNVTLTAGGDVQLSSSASINQQSSLTSTNGVGTTTTTWIAQTFTPSASGALTRIDVNLFCSACTGTAPSYTVRVRTANASGPTGADLASTTVAGTTSGASSAFTALFASPPNLVAGTSYAFIVNANPVPAPGTAAVLMASDDTTYTGGQSFRSNDSGGSWASFTVGTPASRRDLVFAVYLQTGFAASGDLISANKFANTASGQLADWTLQYTGNAPANTTLRFQVAGSNSAAGPFSFVGPDNTTGSFFTSGSTTALSNLRGYTYVRYRALLATTLSTATPTLNDVTLCYQNSEVTNSDSGLQVGRVTLNATVNGTNRVSTVRFARPFAVVPVVIVQPSNDNTDPASLRISNVRPDSFDVLQVEAPGCAGCTGLGGTTSIDWVAAAPGSYRLTQDALRLGEPTRGGQPGPLVKVGTVSTRKHQRGGAAFASWLPTDWEAVSFPVDIPGRTFSSAPVVLTGLQSWNNEGPNMFGPVLSVRNSSTNWESTVTRNINTTGFDLAVEVSEVDDDDAGIPGLDSDERIGYIAIESGVSVNLLSTANTPIALATGVGTANGTCSATALTTLSFPSAPTLANLRGFAGKQSRIDADGGWVRRCAMTAPGGNAVSMTLDVDEDQDFDTERDHATNETIGAAIFGGDLITSPVTIAAMALEDRGNSLRLRFTAATEVGHLGYRLWTRDHELAPWQLVSGLIAGQGGDSMKARSYQADLEGTARTQVRIEDVDLLGRSRFHDLISVGEQRGATPVEPAIDWPAIRAANLENTRQRRIAGKSEVLAFVRVDGPQRVSFESLTELGWPSDVSQSAIAITDAGVAVTRAIVCDKPSTTFGSGCAIEFLGKADKGLYGAENAYLITVNPELARPAYAGAVLSSQTQPGTNIALFNDRLERAPNREYSFSAPGNDPWYDARIYAGTAATTINREFSLPGYHSGNAQLRLTLWGGLNYAGANMDHHVQVLLNGNLLDDLHFDGLSLQELSYTIDASQLQNVNQLQIRLPADTGYAADVVLLDGFSIDYLRNATAHQGVLSFGSFGTGNDRVLYADFESTGSDINGIDGASVLWSERKGQIRRDDVSQNVRVALDTEALWLVPEAQLALPRLAVASPAAPNATSDYLIVTAPELQSELAPLVALQSSRGLSTTVLRTDEIYARYSEHQRSPQAIAQAIAAHRPRFVLLVGGDSYDYHDYLGLGSQSLLPTFYRAADPIVRFAASDAPYADWDGDGAPDVALGRIPARTGAELRRLINAIVARATRPPQSFFASAGKSAANEQFGRHSRALLSYLRQGQSTDFAVVDEIGIVEAAQRTRTALEQADWINYVGHSSPNRWALENLMNTAQLPALNRSNIPGVISQWGCWNSYFVLPNQDSMSHGLLFGNQTIAAAVIGSSSLAEDASHMALATRFFDLVEDGQFDEQGGNVNTIGEALMQAKRNLKQFAPEHIESNYSITLFGDPAQPLR